MPVHLIWGGLAVAGVFGLGWAAQETGEAAGELNQLGKTLIVAGGLYVSYRALKSSGALK